jgi:hypothetical protein
MLIHPEKGGMFMEEIPGMIPIKETEAAVSNTA